MNTQAHFDEIAQRYDSEIPEHVRLHLLRKKTYAMLRHLKSRLPSGGTGLDCGCGTGHYLARMAGHGYTMSGIEYSEGMLSEAVKNNPSISGELKFGSINEIAFADQIFDFAYTINVLHHLPSREAQINAVNEMLRVTKPGGVIFLHDFDADNPLVRFYMNAIFPLTSKIDDDETEIWVSVNEFQKLGLDKGRFASVERFTLLPNFTPRFGFPALAAVETLFERLTARKFGAHFMMAFERLA